MVSRKRQAGGICATVPLQKSELVSNEARSQMWEASAGSCIHQENADRPVKRLRKLDDRVGQLGKRGWGVGGSLVSLT